MVILDVTVINVAVPVMGRELSASLTGIQWITNSYTLIFAGLLLTGGALGDRLGNRRIFCTGVVVFTAASAGCGLAQSTGTLIAARLLEGAGAALIVPASLALLQQAYPSPAERSRAFGLWGSMAGIAASAGPSWAASSSRPWAGAGCSSSTCPSDASACCSHCAACPLRPGARTAPWTGRPSARSSRWWPC